MHPNIYIYIDGFVSYIHTYIIHSHVCVRIGLGDQGVIYACTSVRW